MKQEEKREKERRGEFEKERDRSESRLGFFSPNQHLLTPHIFCSSLRPGSTVSSNAMLTKEIFREGKHKEKMIGKDVVFFVALHEAGLAILR